MLKNYSATITRSREIVSRGVRETTGWSAKKMVIRSTNGCIRRVTGDWCYDMPPHCHITLSLESHPTMSTDMASCAEHAELEKARTLPMQ